MLVITQLSKREELHSHNGINKISSVKEEEGTEEVILITLLMINSIGHLFKSQMQKLSDKNFNNKKSNMAETQTTTEASEEITKLEVANSLKFKATNGETLEAVEEEKIRIIILNNHKTGLMSTMKKKMAVKLQLVIKLISIINTLEAQKVEELTEISIMEEEAGIPLTCPHSSATTETISNIHNSKAISNNAVISLISKDRQRKNKVFIKIANIK